MAETFEDVDNNTLIEFSETYPRASWSPMIYNKFKYVYNIYLHINLHSIEGCGITVTAAKADAIRKYISIVSAMKISTINKKIGDSENMMKNDTSLNYLENKSHFSEDIRPSGMV